MVWTRPRGAAEAIWTVPAVRIIRPSISGRAALPLRSEATQIQSLFVEPPPLTSLHIMSSDTPAGPSSPTPAQHTALPPMQPSAPAPTPEDQPAPQPLSKNAQKRLAKTAYLAEKKKERRLAEKERKKEKKRALAEQRAAGEAEGDEEAERERARKRQKTAPQGPRTPFAARVVVDLGFDDMMTENVGPPCVCARVQVWEADYGGGRARTHAGGQVAHVATRVHVQREPQGGIPVCVAAVHVDERADEGAYGEPQQRRVYAVGRCGVVGGRI